MANKNATKPEAKPVGRPKRTDKDNTKVPGRERGTKPGETRKGYIVNIELADQIDAIAFWDHKKIKDAVQEAFTDYVVKWEKKNGPLKIPNKVSIVSTVNQEVSTPIGKGRIKIKPVKDQTN